MSEMLQAIYLVRHGETAWSLSGQHTGLTDLPLTKRGERNARSLRERLGGIRFSKVITSPLKRAARTCELAGFHSVAEWDDKLVEWNYGDYEGLRTAEIHAQRPVWQLFRDGCPGGESPAQVAARADSVLEGARRHEGNVLMFSSGHISRMLAMRWLGLESQAGGLFMLDPASISVLAFDHSSGQAVIRSWNETSHLNGHP